MAKRAENEGFRVLDEFVCDAIHEPGIPRADPKKQGKNEGIRVDEEFVFGEETGTSETGKTIEKQPREIGLLGESLPRLLHLKLPIKDPAVERISWEQLKAICNEESPSPGVLEQLCVAERDRILAFLESSGRQKAEENRTARDQVWKAVRSRAITLVQTHAFFETVRADLRVLVREVETQPDPSVVIAGLWSPEVIIQDVAREKFSTQMVEIMEELLIDQYA